MNQIFTFFDKDNLYKKCLYASIAHAVMIGKYSLLCDEISWDGKNYLFQNMQGIRGVIAFGDDSFVCAIQNETNFVEGKEEILHNFEPQIIQFLKEEVLPYLEIEENIPAVSTAFWGSKEGNFSYMTEKSVIEKSNGILMPYLYTYSDLIRYWKQYYEADDEQISFINSLYNKRLEYKEFYLDKKQKKQLESWFGSNSKNCIQALKKIGIKY